MGHIWVDENGKLSMENKTQDKHTQDLDIFYFTDLNTSAGIIHENHLHELHHLW